MRWRASGIMALAALILSACGSVPREQLYTLRIEGAEAASATQVASPANASAVAVGPVTIPALIDRPQWVLQDGPGQVRVLEQQLWAQPLQDDIAQAVAAGLNRRLGTVAHADLSGLPSRWPESPRLRVQIDVLRFESRVAPAAGIDDQYRWAVSCVAGGSKAPSRSGITTIASPLASLQVGASPYPALAQAHGLGLQQASSEIAAALDALGSACPAP